MIASNYRKYPEALALQMPLQFGRLLVWATSRPTTRALRAIRAARGATFKAAGRVAYPAKKTTPSWVKEAARKVRELGMKVQAACMQLELQSTTPRTLNPYQQHLTRVGRVLA